MQPFFLCKFCKSAELFFSYWHWLPTSIHLYTQNWSAVSMIKKRKSNDVMIVRPMISRFMLFREVSGFHGIGTITDVTRSHSSCACLAKWKKQVDVFRLRVFKGNFVQWRIWVLVNWALLWLKKCVIRKR